MLPFIATCTEKEILLGEELINETSWKSGGFKIEAGQTFVLLLVKIRPTREVVFI